jgi:hypothetical protein
MSTKIYFELQTRRRYATDSTFTPWRTVFDSERFTETLNEYDAHINSGYKEENLQVLQITKQSIVVIPEQNLRVTEVIK